MTSGCYNSQENILVKCLSLCDLIEIQLIIEGLVVNVCLKKRKQIYFLSFLQALPCKMVVQEKEGMIIVHLNSDILFLFIYLFSLI